MLNTEKRNPKTLHIDQMKTIEMMQVISEENFNAVKAVAAQITVIAKAVDEIAAALEHGGRLFYIGSGTSGRLAVADAAECSPVGTTVCLMPVKPQKTVPKTEKKIFWPVI